LARGPGTTGEEQTKCEGDSQTAHDTKYGTIPMAPIPISSIAVGQGAVWNAWEQSRHVSLSSP
jgi:hypothetical protein